VSNRKALIESGTLGPKGHVQVVVPHLTESYSSQYDPNEEMVAFCTLRQFPTKPEHAIEWAKEKVSCIVPLRYKFLRGNTGELSTRSTKRLGLTVGL